MSGQSNGSRSHPRSYFIRFTVEEDARLTKMLRKRGLTAQAFLHAAAMRAFNEAQLGKKSDAEIVREERVISPEAPRGLGIRERLERDERDRDERDDRNERPMSFVHASTPALQAAQSRAGLDDEIMTLARTIVESPASTRRDVLKAACQALTRGRTQEEALRLADDLDAAIVRLAGVPKTALERVRARTGR